MSATPRLDAVIATERTIAFRAAYVDLTGDVAAALMLAQIIYWTPRSTVERDGRRWIAKADAAWWDEIRLKPEQARRARRVLQETGLVEVRTFKFDGAPTTHLSLNPEAMEQALADLGEEPKSIRAEPQIQSGQSPSPSGPEPKSYTEMTSEMTSEKPSSQSDFQREPAEWREERMNPRAVPTWQTEFAIVERLASQGVKVWRDRPELTPVGRRCASRIASVMVWSQNYNDRKFAFQAAWKDETATEADRRGTAA